MSRKIFVSFLGMGNYERARYKSWKNDAEAEETRYAQRAILELYPHSDIDSIVLFETEKSKNKHGALLWDELVNKLKVDPNKIETEIISEDVSDLSLSWKWFESLQSKFNEDDTLILDVTHGFRMVPIIFSAAVAYLKRVKNVHLDAVLYAAHDIPGCPIVDLKDFYSISDWTEGVGRLVDTADPSFLRKTAESESNGSFAGLNNQDLLNSIDDLTKAFRNVELQNIEDKARKSLDLICEFQKQSSGNLEGQVLQMIIDKFQPLISEPPLDGTYSLDYLNLQLRLIKMLAEYKLYMQAFTAMNEWLGSLGVFLLYRGNKFRIDSVNKDKKARMYAGVFLRMLEFGDEFKPEREIDIAFKEALDKPYCMLCERFSSREQIEALIENSKKIRNGFNHGWTGENRNGVPSDIDDIFSNAMATLEKIVSKIEKDA